MPVSLRRNRKSDFPLILYWEFNHFVVLEGIDDDIAYLNDPALGRRKVPWDDFETSYTGVYLKIYPGENFVKEGHPYNVFKTIAEKLAEDKKAVIFALLIGFCMIIPGLSGAVFNQIFIDDILTMKQADWIAFFCAAMGASVLFSGFLNLLRSTVLTMWQKN